MKKRVEGDRITELEDSFAHEMYACRDPRDRLMLALKWLTRLDKKDQEIIFIVYEEEFPDE